MEDDIDTAEIPILRPCVIERRLSNSASADRLAVIGQERIKELEEENAALKAELDQLRRWGFEGSIGGEQDCEGK